MSHTEQGPLAGYNSLSDSHLAGFFANTRIRRHLIKAGLVSRRGEIISETTFRLNAARKEHKKYVKDLLAQAIVHKTLDLERHRQVQIRKTLEDIAKIELVRRIRSEKSDSSAESLLPYLSQTETECHRAKSSSRENSRREEYPPRPRSRQATRSVSPTQRRNRRAQQKCSGDEDILPLLSPRSRSPRSRPQSGPARKYPLQRYQKIRPASAPSHVVKNRLSPRSYIDDGYRTIYVDEDGQPLAPSPVSDKNQNQNTRPGGEKSFDPSKEELDSRHLYSLDTTALRKYATAISRREDGHDVVSPYLLPQTSYPVPTPPKTPRTQSRASTARLSRPRSVRSEGGGQGSSRQRPWRTTLQRHHSEGVVLDLDERQSPTAAEGNLAWSDETVQKRQSCAPQGVCYVTMKYHGKTLSLPHDQVDPYQQITVDQQHCGGNTLCVFYKRILPGTSFRFVSKRHHGYPFSMSLFIDGLMDCRVSACCEYKHTPGSRIGGSHGHFSITEVSGSEPCFRCRYEKEMKEKEKKKKRKLKESKERKREMEEEATAAEAAKQHDAKQEEPVDDVPKIIIPVEDSDLEDSDNGEVTPAYIAVEQDDDNNHDNDDDNKDKSEAVKGADGYEEDFEDEDGDETKMKQSDVDSTKRDEKHAKDATYGYVNDNDTYDEPSNVRDVEALAHSRTSGQTANDDNLLAIIMKEGASELDGTEEELATGHQVDDRSMSVRMPFIENEIMSDMIAMSSDESDLEIYKDIYDDDDADVDSSLDDDFERFTTRKQKRALLEDNSEPEIENNDVLTNVMEVEHLVLPEELKVEGAIAQPELQVINHDGADVYVPEDVLYTEIQQPEMQIDSMGVPRIINDGVSKMSSVNEHDDVNDTIDGVCSEKVIDKKISGELAEMSKENDKDYETVQPKKSKSVKSVTFAEAEYDEIDSPRRAKYHEDRIRPKLLRSDNIQSLGIDIALLENLNVNLKMENDGAAEVKKSPTSVSMEPREIPVVEELIVESKRKVSENMNSDFNLADEDIFAQLQGDPDDPHNLSDSSDENIMDKFHESAENLDFTRQLLGDVMYESYPHGLNDIEGLVNANELKESGEIEDETDGHINVSQVEESSIVPIGTIQLESVNKRQEKFTENRLTSQSNNSQMRSEIDYSKDELKSENNYLHSQQQENSFLGGKSNEKSQRNFSPSNISVIQESISELNFNSKDEPLIKTDNIVLSTSVTNKEIVPKFAPAAKIDVNENLGLLQSEKQAKEDEILSSNAGSLENKPVILQKEIVTLEVLNPEKSENVSDLDDNHSSKELVKAKKENDDDNDDENDNDILMSEIDIFIKEILAKIVESLMTEKRNNISLNSNRGNETLPKADDKFSSNENVNENKDKREMDNGYSGGIAQDDRSDVALTGSGTGQDWSVSEYEDNPEEFVKLVDVFISEMLQSILQSMIQEAGSTVVT